LSSRNPCPSGATTNCTGRLWTIARERATRSAPATRAVAPVNSDVVLRRGRKPATIVNARPRMTSTTMVSIRVKPSDKRRRCPDTGASLALLPPSNGGMVHCWAGGSAGPAISRYSSVGFLLSSELTCEFRTICSLDFRRLPGSESPRCSAPYRPVAAPAPRPRRSPRTDRWAAPRRHPSSGSRHPARSHEILRPAGHRQH